MKIFWPSAALVLLLAGCGSSDSPEPTAAPGSGAAPAPAAGGLTQDCTAAVGAFRDLTKSLISASASGGADTGKALADYAAAARGQAAKVTDPGLKAALESSAASAERVSASGAEVFEDAEFEKSTGDIEKACADALTPTVEPGTPATTLGAKGSECELPVTFDLVALWKPKAVDLAELGELGSLYRNGPFEVVCEVDAKPAGEVGFLRVSTAPGRKGTPRAHLKAYVAAENPEARKAGNFEVRKTTYKDIEVGGQKAAEVTYETYNKSMDHESKYSAFALNTPSGAVVVKLSPFGADEHENVLPAFDLAKKTLKVNS